MNGKCWSCQATGSRGEPRPLKATGTVGQQQALKAEPRRRKANAKNASEKPERARPCMWARLDLFLLDWRVTRLYEGGIFQSNRTQNRVAVALADASASNPPVGDDVEYELVDEIEEDAIDTPVGFTDPFEVEPSFNFDEWHGDIAPADLVMLEAAQSTAPRLSQSTLRLTNDEVETAFQQIRTAGNDMYKTGDNFVAGLRYDAVAKVHKNDHGRAVAMIADGGLDDAVVQAAAKKLSNRIVRWEHGE